MNRPALAVALIFALAPWSTPAGELRGIVRFQGAAPAPAPLETTKERAVCGDSVPDEAVQVAAGMLRNVVVAVKGAPAPAPGKGVLDSAAVDTSPTSRPCRSGAPSRW